MPIQRAIAEKREVESEMRLTGLVMPAWRAASRHAYHTVLSEMGLSWPRFLSPLGNR
jgi:hypothetical protein